MAVSVLIPTPLRNLTAQRDTVEFDDPGTIAGLVERLEQAHPGMGNRLRGDDGSLRRFINVYVNDEDIRFLQGPDTPLKDGDQVSIVPAIAGGAAPVTEHFNFTFNKQMSRQPVIYNLGKKFNLVTIIERANISEDAGWMQVALRGDADEIQRALADLSTFGVFVTPVELAMMG